MYSQQHAWFYTLDYVIVNGIELNLNAKFDVLLIIC